MGYHANIDPVARLNDLINCMKLQQRRETAYGKFSMRTNKIKGNYEPYQPIKARTMKKCDFTGCALGISCAYYHLKKRGIVGFFDEDGNLYIEFNGKTAPYSDKDEFYQVAADFFGITVQEAVLLFDYEAYSENVGPGDVIDKAKNMIKEYRSA